ncbi:hypothetical protein [Paenibacillus sp. RUD330]|uniref:hypothetical protein n=1 Tax=Paenibacillus sp. RUD330 TaxID=2023772 RepID=UPI000B92A1CC|nr:hypothetical protein [Paenibacillus sp. RUD330]ASS66995.1 hypothetical protein CIC07_13275 [Paenibacillus sp. RUD330]
MYGHQFYQYRISKCVDFLYRYLRSGNFESLEVLAADIYIAVEDMKEELRSCGYFIVPELNQFMKIDMGEAN